jgi:hypothetical protein
MKKKKKNKTKKMEKEGSCEGGERKKKSRHAPRSSGTSKARAYLNIYSAVSGIGIVSAGLRQRMRAGGVGCGGARKRAG